MILLMKTKGYLKKYAGICDGIKNKAINGKLITGKIT